MVLGRAQPVLSVLGEAATDVAMLFERTAVGWMSVRCACVPVHLRCVGLQERLLTQCCFVT